MTQFDVMGITVQLLNLFMLGIWLILLVIALIELRKRRLEPVVQALWAILIVVAPILGPLGFFVIAPGRER